MHTARAHIRTDRASRYLTQLCQHGHHMGSATMQHAGGHNDGGTPPNVRHAEWTDTDGIIDFGWGRCILHATADELILIAESADPEHLQRVQDGIAARLQRIGRRDHLSVVWQATP